jgi:hypothetical protein
MTPFLSRYMQQWHHEKQYWLTRAEKRRAFMLTCGIMVCVTITVMLWLLH